jgi:hypothetical protein
LACSQKTGKGRQSSAMSDRMNRASAAFVTAAPTRTRMRENEEPTCAAQESDDGLAKSWDAVCKRREFVESGVSQHPKRAQQVVPDYAVRVSREGQESVISLFIRNRVFSVFRLSKIGQFCQELTRCRVKEPDGPNPRSAQLQSLHWTSMSLPKGHEI